MKKYNKKSSFIVTSILLAFMLTLLTPMTASADIEKKSAKDLSDTLINAVRSYALPLGGAIIFIAVVIIAISIIVSANNPKARAEKMSSLLWVGIGAAVLGLATLITGVLMSAFNI
jgi:TRAP-type C4-dicarboxylate transport system permease small subunit